MQAISIRIDDVRGAQSIALLEAHRQNMFELSPPECVFALDLDGLRQPEGTLWTAWQGEDLLGCGALKEWRAPWLHALRPVCRLRGRPVQRVHGETPH
jgi:putative acetyltransferase